jgi:UDP-2,3-diacylglucosamine hydrolase
MDAGPLPEFARVEAPPAWRSIDFISDLHLCEGMPRTFEAWAAYLRATPADAVFILGDLFEVWIGDDTRSQPFERACVQALVDAAAHRHLAFMAGNRDFLLGSAMCSEAQLQRLDDPTVLRALGQDWLLTHGDALCLEDLEYQAFRRQVRSEAWQQAFLAKPLDERARLARAIRQESQSRKDAASSSMVWADVDSDAALAWLAATNCLQMIHGHTHRPGTTALGPGKARHVLSDWDFDHGAARADALRLDANGLRRVDLAGLC